MESISGLEQITFNPGNMISVTRKLSDILATEIALLKDMQILKVNELHDDKITLTGILEEYKNILQNNPEILNSVPENVMDEMRFEATKFEKLIEEDKEQIIKATEAHKLLLGIGNIRIENTVI